MTAHDDDRNMRDRVIAADQRGCRQSRQTRKYDVEENEIWFYLRNQIENRPRVFGLHRLVVVMTEQRSYVAALRDFVLDYEYAGHSTPFDGFNLSGCLARG